LLRIAHLGSLLTKRWGYARERVATANFIR
jgi:hypothetical protein